MSGYLDPIKDLGGPAMSAAERLASDPDLPVGGGGGDLDDVVGDGDLGAEATESTDYTPFYTPTLTPRGLPPTVAQLAQQAHKRLEVMSEDELLAEWQRAPLITSDSLYFEYVGYPVAPAALTALLSAHLNERGVDGSAVTITDAAGTIFVLVPAGSGRDCQSVLVAYFKAEGIATNGIRPVFGKRRRGLSDLRPAFLKDVSMAMSYVGYSYLSARRRAIMAYLEPDSSERFALCNAWVLDILSQYDAEMGKKLIPFVLGKMEKAPVTLAREREGRRQTDLSTKIARAEQQCVEDGVPATVVNMAARANMTEPKFVEALRLRQRAYAFRTAASLTIGGDAAGGWDSRDIKDYDLPSGSLVEDTIVDDVRAHSLSAALILGTIGVNGKKLRDAEDCSYQALLVNYFSSQSSWTKSDLAKAAGLSSNTLTDRVRIANVRVQKILLAAEL